MTQFGFRGRGFKQPLTFNFQLTQRHDELARYLVNREGPNEPQ